MQKHRLPGRPLRWSQAFFTPDELVLVINVVSLQKLGYLDNENDLDANINLDLNCLFAYK